MDNSSSECLSDRPEKKVKKEIKKDKDKVNTKKWTDDEGVNFQLDKLKILKVKKFKGKVYVDIRNYYEKEGKLLPTQKGISITPDQWKCVKSLIEDIDEAINIM